MILLVSPFRDQGSQFRMSTKIIVYIASQYCKQEVMRQKLTLKSIQFVYCPGTVTPTFPSLVPDSALLQTELVYVGHGVYISLSVIERVNITRVDLI